MPRTANNKNTHMTQLEKQDWNALYEYVRSNVMGYDMNQSLSKQMCLRLKGLLKNKFMENHNTPDTANYPYQVVLNTFKFCNPDIQRGFSSNTFRDESHRFNYALKIVEHNLNDVYIRMRDAEKSKKVAEEHDVSESTNYVNTFKSKKNNDNKKYDDLW